MRLLDNSMIKKKGKNKIEKEPQWARHLGIKVENIDHKVSLIAEQYGDIKKTLASHTEMIGSMKVDIEIIKQDIAFIKNSLKKKVDIEEFVALERRVALLEKRR